MFSLVWARCMASDSKRFQISVAWHVYATSLYLCHAIVYTSMGVGGDEENRRHHQQLVSHSRHRLTMLSRGRPRKPAGSAAVYRVLSVQRGRVLTYIKRHIALLCACVYVCVCMCIWHCDCYPFMADTPVALLTCHAWHASCMLTCHACVIKRHISWCVCVCVCVCV